MRMRHNKEIFINGYRHGIPIGLGYFAVAFSLGIAAREYGFSAAQGFLASLVTYASAGQYMGFALYATNATLIELIILTFIINARYILMGFALNQRMPEGTPLRTRLLVSSCITDEIFGITIARPGVPTPFYTFGALIAAVPLWALGTALGISMGNILPARVVSALSVALFGMFIAVIVPPSRKDRAIGIAVLTSFAFSYAFANLPLVSELSEGNRTIILTIAISALFAALMPRTNKDISTDAADSGDGGAK
ncbi:MAG: AzlC family ABC transporter permease [Mogibacterium sp.]|nr:AzlC family ABC transporter permease [Mogibacterium sp.]